MNILFYGPSGSGKTTLVKLLVGLYKAQMGNILYNDIDAAKIDIDELVNQADKDKDGEVFKIK